MNAILLGVVALQAAASWPWVGDADPPAHLLKPGVATLIRASWAGSPVVVRILPVAVANCHALAWFHGIAPDRRDRCTRIGRIDVSIAGRTMAVTSTRYADLGGIRDVVLRTSPGAMTLYMRGPDGPEYYGATLTFDRHDIVRRQLDLGDDGREVTTYAAGGLDAVAGWRRLRPCKTGRNS